MIILICKHSIQSIAQNATGPDKEVLSLFMESNNYFRTYYYLFYLLLLCKFSSVTGSTHYGQKVVQLIDPSSNIRDGLQWLTLTSLWPWKSFDFHSYSF